jgi:DNA replication protein DnaC
MGPPGRGKTGLAVSALRRYAGRWLVRSEWNWFFGHRMAKHRKPPATQVPNLWYERWFGCTRRLLHLQNTGDSWEDYDETLDSLLEAEFLILDDVDAGRFTDWRETLLCQMVERAYEGKRTVLIVNTPLSRLAEALGERIADRLMDTSAYMRVVLAGDSSLRQREQADGKAK